MQLEIKSSIALHGLQSKGNAILDWPLSLIGLKG